VVGGCTALVGAAFDAGDWEVQPFITSNPHNGGDDGSFAWGWVDTTSVMMFDEIEAADTNP